MKIEPDWSKFIPKDEIPVGPPESWHSLHEGDVFASWDHGAGMVLRRAALNAADPLAGNFGPWNQWRVRLIRRADGRWAAGYNPSGPCLPSCGTDKWTLAGGRQYCTPWCSAAAASGRRDDDSRGPAAGSPVAPPPSISELLAMLRSLEWSGRWETRGGVCPICTGYNDAPAHGHGPGHATGCALAALLARAGGETPPTDAVAPVGSVVWVVTAMQGTVEDSAWSTEEKATAAQEEGGDDVFSGPVRLVVR